MCGNMYISYFQHMFAAYAGSNFRSQQRCGTLDRKCKTPEPHVAATIGTVYDAGLSVLVGEVEIIPHLRATQQKTGRNEQSGSLIWPRFIQQGCYSIRQFRGENSIGWDKTWWTGMAAGTATHYRWVEIPWFPASKPKLLSQHVYSALLVSDVSAPAVPGGCGGRSVRQVKDVKRRKKKIETGKLKKEQGRKNKWELCDQHKKQD